MKQTWELNRNNVLRRLEIPGVSNNTTGILEQKTTTSWKQKVREKSRECKNHKKVREKSRECHNHKPQPFPDPKRKRKPTNLNKHKPNKRTKSTKISSLFPKRGNRNTKRTGKHKNKMTYGKTYNKSPRRINHKATKSKTNTGTTALERSVEQTTGGVKALLQLANFTLGPDATLNTEIHKNSIGIKAPSSVNASKRKHKNQINHYNKQRRVLMANSTVCQRMKTNSWTTAGQVANHKSQPFPDTKRKRKQTQPNRRHWNKHTKSTIVSSLFPKRGNRNAQSSEKKKKKKKRARTK